MLIPPAPPRGRSLNLRNARSVNKSDPACGIAGREIELTWRGRTARVALDRDAVGPAAGVNLAGGPISAAATPVRDLAWWTRFGEELAQREKNGCIAAGDSKRISGRIVENVAMPSGLAYQLRYGNFLMTGYLDLEPEFVLSAVAPLLKPGVTKFGGAEDVAGYETVRYDLKRRGDGGLRIVLRSVEHNMAGKVSVARHPATDVIRLPESAHFIRYYFRMWNVSGDRKIALLATARPDLLDPMSVKFEADPEGFCKSVKAAEAACLSVPTQMMIVPELRVLVNGKPVYILAGGTLGHALRAAGIKDPKKVAEIRPALRVLRPYGGVMTPVEFDRAHGDILSLVPIGGEDIRW